jgi:hypothetical protein
LLLLRVGKMAREMMLVAALVLCLLLVCELVLLRRLLMGRRVKNGLTVLLRLQLGGQ